METRTAVGVSLAEEVVLRESQKFFSKLWVGLTPERWLCTKPSTLQNHALRNSRTKRQPKEEVLGRTSRGHPGIIRADILAQNRNNKYFGADIHDPKARTSTTLKDSQRLRSEFLWAKIFVPQTLQNHALRMTLRGQGCPLLSSMT